MKGKIKWIIFLICGFIIICTCTIIRIQRVKVQHVITAIEENNMQELSTLLEGNINLDMTRQSEAFLDVSSNYTPLIVAVKLNNLEAVKLLIEAGADSNKDMRWFGTPLHFAVAEDVDIEIMKYLIESGANVNKKSGMGYTPLGYMFRGYFDANKLENYDYIRFEKVKYLIDKGAILDNCSPYDHILLAACGSNDLVTVKYLIEELKFNVNFIKEGVTPLMICAKKTPDENHIEVCKYLLFNGADYTIKNNDGKTVYDLAIEENNILVIELLNQYMKHVGTPVNECSN